MLISLNDDNRGKKNAIKAFKQNAVLSPSGNNYQFTDEMFKNYKNKLLVKNAIAGLIIAGFTFSVYGYSIYAVKQDAITDEYLKEIKHQKNKTESI